MPITWEASELFADAEQVQERAIRQLEQGDIGDAAEKAWRAAMPSTNG
jgi:hypothetical protein